MSWITFDNLKRFWKGIRTNPVTFTGEIDLQNTTRYKGKEIATKADITTSAGFQNPATETLHMGDRAIEFHDCLIRNGIDGSLKITSKNYPIVLKVSTNQYAFDSDGAYFTNITVTDHLAIPGGQIRIE